MKIFIEDHEGVRVLVVGGEAFDWGFDEEAYRNADPHMREVLIGNIQKHFIDSFSEFIGRSVTLTEINKAIELGEI